MLRLTYSYNPGQTFWDKFALLVLLGTRQTTPTPLTMLNTTTCIFFLIFDIVLGGEGEEQLAFKGKQRFFQTSVIKHRLFVKLHVSQGLLFTIVACFP